jgi:hypothetical protein
MIEELIDPIPLKIEGRRLWLREILAKLEEDEVIKSKDLMKSDEYP